MLSASPYGLFVKGGAALSTEDLSAVDATVRRMTNQQQLGGLPAMKMVRTLPGGGAVIVLSIGGVLRAIVLPSSEAVVATVTTTDVTTVPMLFSGVITSSLLTDASKGVGIRLTTQARRRIAGYPATDVGLPDKDQSLQRFVISYNTALVSEFLPADTGSLTYTQYVQQRPTWYSGAMAEVMQIVGGYGVQDLSSLPRTNKVERAKMVLPASVVTAVAKELEGVLLPGYAGSPPSSGQFQYDYKFNQTHAVGVGDDGTPWLLRMKSGGLYAMPLPLIPATTTTAFRKYVKQKDDQEILTILDRFGGMPSGESFPSISGAFEAWRRAGVVMKLCELSEFYTHSAYFTGCGWSFNAKGTAAFNTCYDYDEDDTGYPYGLAYALNISYGKPTFIGGRQKAQWKFSSDKDQAVVTAYLAALLKLMATQLAKNSGASSSTSTSSTSSGSGIYSSGTSSSSSTTSTSDSSLSARYAAIRYKWYRKTAAELLERAKSVTNVTSTEVDYWDNLEMDPIATHTASMSQTARGWLYNKTPSTSDYAPQAKFPEPAVGGCVSHDFLPMIGKGGSLKCDTIMFGYYIGDVLKVVKYFYDPNSSSTTSENNYEDCMIVGSWTETTYNTTKGPMGFFYTTDFDDRLSGASSTTVTNTVGKDLGYDTTPRFAYDGFFYRIGTLSRVRHYQHSTTATTTKGYSMDLAVCVPYLCRNAVLYARRELTSGASVTKSVQLGYVEDPTSYRYWTWDSVFRWRGSLDVMLGDPYPKSENPVWASMEQYSSSNCSDFADQGSWMSLPADITYIVHPNANEHAENGGGSTPSVKEYSKTTTQAGTDVRALKLSFPEQDQTLSVTPENWYWTPSPDASESYFYRDGAKVLFGSMAYANVSETSGDVRLHWGYSSLADSKSAHHFIGVINE